MTLSLLPGERRARLKTDPFPPPPDTAHGPAECRTCRRVRTMHTSGECHWCGDWVTETDAANIQPGDLIYDFLDWELVHGIAVDGEHVRVVLENRPKPLRIGAESTVYLSTAHRRETL